MKGGVFLMNSLLLLIFHHSFEAILHFFLCCCRMKEYPPKLDIVLARALRRLLVATFSRSPRDTFSREPKTFALMFSVELDRKLSL